MRVIVEARRKPALEFDSDKDVHSGTTTCSHVHSSAAGNNHFVYASCGREKIPIYSRVPSSPNYFESWTFRPY